MNGHLRVSRSRRLSPSPSSPLPADESSGAGRARSVQPTRSRAKSAGLLQCFNRPSGASLEAPIRARRSVSAPHLGRSPRAPVRSPSARRRARPSTRVRVEQPCSRCPDRSPKRPTSRRPPSCARSDTFVATARPSEDGSSSASSRQPRPLSLRAEAPSFQDQVPSIVEPVPAGAFTEHAPHCRGERTRHRSTGVKAP